MLHAEYDALFTLKIAISVTNSLRERETGIFGWAPAEVRVAAASFLT